eukprot:403348466
MNVPNMNMGVKQKQQELDRNMENLVLFDPHRMFRGEQNVRVQEILKSGKNSLTAANLKQNRNRFNSTQSAQNTTLVHGSRGLNLFENNHNHKKFLNQSLVLQSSSSQHNHKKQDNIDITQHLMAFSSSLKPFYRQHKIVPETMIEDRHKNKECYVLQVLPKSQQQQRRNIRTATTALSYSSQSQLRNRLLSNEPGRFKGFDIGLGEVNEFDMRSQGNVTQFMPPHARKLDSTIIDDHGQQDLVTLQRKFEDNESNIIHDLYSKHFQHKTTTKTQLNDSLVITETQNINHQPIQNTNLLNANDRSAIMENKFESSQSRQILDNYLTNPNESLSISDNRTLSARRQIKLNDQKILETNLNGFEKVKYVQYVPKADRADTAQESMINQMYLNSPNQINTLNASLNNFNLNHSLASIGEQRCLTSHQHARRGCNKFKELDVAELQNKAFQQLKVENQQIFEKAQDNRNYKASFFPSSQMPEELIEMLKENEEFQKTMLINNKLLLSKPDKFGNTQSRFYQHNTKSSSPNGFQFNQLQVLNGYLNQNPQNLHESHRQALLQLRRSQIAQKVQNQNERKFEETYDSNKVDPYQLHQEEQQLLEQDPSQNINLLNMNSDLQQQLILHQNSQGMGPDRNFYYPKVSILNNFNVISQDSKLTNQQVQNILSSWDFSQTPISQNVLKLNIEKECVKFHQSHANQLGAAKNDSRMNTNQNVILTSKTPSEDGLLLNQLSPHHNQDPNRLSQALANRDNNNLTQQIFRPRNLLSGIGSSQMLSPTTNGHLDQNQAVYSDQTQQNNLLNKRKAKSRINQNQQQQPRENRFFNFNEINQLQQKKWMSPFVHQKNCEQNRKINLRQNELKNFEKSNKVQLAQSLNSQVNNNPYELWNRNENKSNLQTRKRQSLQSSALDQYDQNLSNSPNKQLNKSLIEQNAPKSLMAFKVKKYLRPNTTQLQKRQRIDKKQSAKGINTLDIASEQMQQYLSLVGQTSQNLNNGSFLIENQNNQLRFETESLSMSSGNINATVHNQQSSNLEELQNIHNSQSNNQVINGQQQALDGNNKRLIISKRSGDIYSKKKKNSGASGSRMMFNELGSTSNINPNSDGNLLEF